MKKLVSLCLGAAACLCAWAQGPFGNVAAPAGHQEILTIKIDIRSSETVTAGTQSVTMISFAGSVDCANFKGEVLPTGVDTQMGGPSDRTLSARYMIKGRDLAGQDCSIFIENNAVASEPYTHPTVVTDSKALAYLNGATLLGRLDMSGGGLTIRVYCPDALLPKK